MSDSEFVQAFRSSQEGRFEEAIAAFEELLKHQPDSAQAHYNLGNSHNGRREYLTALTAYREAIRVQPDFVEAHMQLGLAYLEQEQFDVRVVGDDLVVSGEREIEREDRGERFHRVERPYGKFLRRFHLPSTVNKKAVAASFRDGLLRITLPNQGQKQPDPIRVAIQ